MRARARERERERERDLGSKNALRHNLDIQEDSLPVASLRQRREVST